MAAQTFVIDSPLPPETAFAMLIDLTRVTEWDEGIRASRLLDGEPGCIGTTYEVTVTGFDGKPTEAVYELTAVTPGVTFTMVGAHPDFRADDTVAFEATADGCRVTYDASLVLLGDEPPLTDAQLDGLFASIVAVPAAGLRTFLG